MNESWTCPYCNRPCTIGDSDAKFMSDTAWISKDYGTYKGNILVVTCPNPDCRQQEIKASLHKWDSRNEQIIEDLHVWQLVPESEAKPFPDYIPKQLRDDYSEACLIKNKSPKASATLSRRCLQGMIRDFWNIRKGRLVDEISALEEKVDSATWEAIDSVRHVGNIGAHMGKDVNLIIDVDPKEAGLLIWLIETLFEEWYIRKHDRESKMGALKEMAVSKKEAKNPNKTGDDHTA